MSETVRIEPTAHATLREIAQVEHVTLTEALTRAVEAYRRTQFFAGLSADYAALRADPEAWAEELRERADWECTLLDGLENEPPYPDPQKSKL